MAEADTRVSVDERLVDFSSFRILSVELSSARRKRRSAAIVAAIKASMPHRERVLALDRVLAYVDASRIRPKNDDGVKADPPVVFFSTRPALLVNLDGDPVWSPIQSNDLRFAVNTNWDLFEHPPSKTYYLRHEPRGSRRPTCRGPWTAAGTLPPSFAQASRRRELERGPAALARPRRLVGAAARCSSARRRPN